MNFEKSNFSGESVIDTARGVRRQYAFTAGQPKSLPVDVPPPRPAIVPNPNTPEKSRPALPPQRRRRPTFVPDPNPRRFPR
jgi:hypothetical protein